jgi:DNA-binding response OmpR family regulator
MPLMHRLFSLIGSQSKAMDQRGDQLVQLPDRRVNRRMNARQGTRVLIIDDCKIAQAELAKLFASAGFSVSQTEESERGLSMACFEYPELVVLDVGMPGMNGFEVLKRMRRDPLARRIPVIMISGNPRVAEHMRKIKLDADGFLRKPFTRQAIFILIENMLDENKVPRRGNARHHFLPPNILKSIRQHLFRH